MFSIFQTENRSYQCFVLLILIGIMMLISCSSNTEITEENDESEVTVSETDVVKSAFISVPFERPSQQTGHYFSYRFRTSDDRIYNIDEFLNSLYTEGFEINSAWYFAGPTCGSSKTIYHPQLIVQLASRDLRLKNFNFVPITDQLIFKCSESTIMYIPSK